MLFSLAVCQASSCIWMVKASKCKSKDTPRLYWTQSVYFSMLSDTIFFHTLRGGHSWLLGHLRRFCGDIDCLLFSERYVLFKEIGKLFCRSYEDTTTSTRKLCVKNSATYLLRAYVITASEGEFSNAWAFILYSIKVYFGHCFHTT